jgi:hypothetical protein
VPIYKCSQVCHKQLVDSFFGEGRRLVWLLGSCRICQKIPEFKQPVVALEPVDRFLSCCCSVKVNVGSRKISISPARDCTYIQASPSSCSVTKTDDIRLCAQHAEKRAMNFLIVESSYLLRPYAVKRGIYRQKSKRRRKKRKLLQANRPKKPRLTAPQ